MPRACSACVRNHTECKVHVRSGVCGECHLRGSKCNIRITKSEWERLRSERERLLREIREAREAQAAAHQAQLAAQRSAADAFAREIGLREKMASLEKDAEDAIAVEDARLSSLEESEGVRDEGDETLDLPPSSGLALSPYTWSITAGIPDEQFWAPSLSVPWVVSSEPASPGGSNGAGGTAVSG
jgi:hypothetical protein